MDVMDEQDIVRFEFKMIFGGIFYITTSVVCVDISGGRLNKKDGLTRYGNSHVKDKTS